MVRTLLGDFLRENDRFNRFGPAELVGIPIEISNTRSRSPFSSRRRLRSNYICSNNTQFTTREASFVTLALYISFQMNERSWRSILRNRVIELRRYKAARTRCFRSVAITRGRVHPLRGTKRRWKTRVVFSAREITIRRRERRGSGSVSRSWNSPRLCESSRIPADMQCTPSNTRDRWRRWFSRDRSEFASRRGICVRATNFPRDPRISIVPRSSTGLWVLS